MERRLVRKSHDKVLGGVCSGLAEYIGADVTFIRLIALFGIIATAVFPGVFLYIICVIIIPTDTQAGGGYNPGGPGYEQYEYKSYGPSKDNTRYLIGIALIVFGVFLFARMFFNWLDWRYVFAGLLILGGLYMLFGSRRDY